ncbi:MAG: peptide deformylase [Armatimonadetes bacterium]|nr:peptide deformylase [Armatimonadota bacterium]
MDDAPARVRKILLCTHPILRKKAQTVQRADRALRRLLDEMVDTMQAAPGLGLAAPQVGEGLRCCVVAVPEEGGARKLVNPRIVKRQGRVVDPEGCLSLPTLQGLVPRARKITVKALDERMRPDCFDAEGLYARAIQHELDHLDGILFTDRVLDGELAWQVPDDTDEDGYRLEPATIEEVMEIFARLAKERGEET